MTTTQQHSYEVWASTLLYSTFAVSLVTDFLLGCGYFAPHLSPWQMLMLGVTPLLLFVYYKIRQGNQGAKVFFLTLYGFVLLHILAGGVPAASYATPLAATSLLLQHGLQIGACALMLLSMQKPAKALLKA